MRRNNATGDDIDLGCFTVDVVRMSNGKYDMTISRDGDSGNHYRGIDANQVGKMVADYIICFTEVSIAKARVDKTREQL